MSGGGSTATQRLVRAARLGVVVCMPPATDQALRWPRVRRRTHTRMLSRKQGMALACVQSCVAHVYLRWGERMRARVPWLCCIRSTETQTPTLFSVYAHTLTFKGGRWRGRSRHGVEVDSEGPGEAFEGMSLFGK